MVDYYDRAYERYFHDTVHVDPSPYLNPVVPYLVPGGEVWDVGCGSGRDLKWLKLRGFNPVGMERSRGLARLAEAHSGCRVILGDFTTFAFSRVAVDGIFLTGALVHVPWDKLPSLLNHIGSGVKPGGILFLSLKQGHGIREDKWGRRFYLWQESDLGEIFHGMPFKSIYTSKMLSTLKTGESWLAHALRKRA